MFAYLITKDNFFSQKVLKNATLKIQQFNAKYNQNIILKYACLRYINGKDSIKNDIDSIESFCNICTEFNITPLFNLSENILEISQLLSQKTINVGIHLKDSMLDIIDNQNIVNLKPKFYSAHSLDSITLALSKNIDYVTISPIYYDKYNKALGVNYLANLDSNLKSKLIALGGINTESKIIEIKKLNLAGFASISYFL
ncbi:hypothetical protein DCO58_11305 [Helicobacter saguini]|uniref:Thiamine phosphate synthase/TenI domain-containing protein n=1 Tax=Helicobacter saguini TaxID=1548018 RepID=A0A347VQ14_9HELI|nr:thiamine phosphate synthase [Helicobacter saguini]MWV61122.1 hypothetical protein [Helicobacter saguini]MWV68209.1 hypothetical protein [Helicobacter saguini]MWV70327.1 hypothetical protein [Helicobacter saguini]MWV72229.1 hypothetical protein [Helicobacter saguini]TLD95278.1 hypothetical protein LS64_002675 [Helicobacter saguini]